MTNRASTDRTTTRYFLRNWVDNNKQYREKILSYVLTYCLRTGDAVAPILAAALAGHPPPAGPELYALFEARHRAAAIFERPELEDEFLVVSEAIKYRHEELEKKDPDAARLIFGLPPGSAIYPNQDGPFGVMYCNLLVYLESRRLIYISLRMPGQWWVWQSIVPVPGTPAGFGCQP